MRNLYNATMETIEGINKARSPAEISSHLASSLKHHGIESFLITGVPNVEEGLEKSIILNGWPVGWIEIYLNEDFYNFDPIAAHTRTASRPFLWSEVDYNSNNKNIQRVMDTAKDYRMKNGFCVPFPGQNEEVACATMSGEFFDIEEDVKVLAQVASLYAYLRIHSQSTGTKRSDQRLSSREREVLKWASEGKTNWEIGTILGISSRTVHFHVQRAMAKLGSSNRTAAIVKAIHTGEISIN